jgi:diguanylate cyclase (GGDEF)-like protein/PAS domain S-box-containing protein
MNRRARSQLPLLILFIGFAVAMCVCVVGLMLWKAAEERRMTIERAEINTQNLANSLARHAGSAFQAADVAIGGIAELMRFQTPVPERINPYLAQRIQALPQIREIVVLGPDGRWLFTSLPELATYSNEDRDYFQYHKASVDTAVRISSLRARLSGRPTILLTKRISRQDGSFAGVVLATIDTDYFRKVYESFRLGHDGSISLLHGDGRVLARWPGEWTELDLSQTELFTARLSASPAGFYRIRSMFDGVEKYFAYRQESQYPIIATVARSEAEVLALWREGVRQDLIVAIAMLAAIVLLAALITHQFSLRARMVAELRERESRYRLLADNIADIVVMFDANGDILYTSPAVTRTMGFLPDELVGTSCFDLVRHEDDARAIKKASHEATADNAKTVEFCAVRKDKTDVWLEANFRRADQGGDMRMVAVLRDISVRRRMEGELQKLTDKLARLATTDALSGLANRRAFDDFLEEQFARHERTSMLLIDIDNFKAFNDTLGHQAGDRCIGAVARVIADVTRDTGALGARYGGEEFAVVLPALGEAEAATVATAIRLGVRALGIAHPGASRGFVSISIGVACKQRVESSGRALVADADLALYQAKELGRNCVVAASSLRRAAADETLDSTAS